MAKELRVSTGTISKVLTQDLKVKKLKKKWVPRELTDEQKQCRVALSRLNLYILRANPTDFWRRLLTVDETWIHHFTPESAEATREWTFAGELPSSATRKGPSAGKVMATIFWDSRGIVLIDYLAKGTTITAEYYAALLAQVNSRVRSSRPGLHKKKLLLLHDNAPPHTADVAAAKLTELGIDVVHHPPYSPDLAPSDYFLFTGLKKHLAGSRFSSDAAVIAAVDAYFESKTSEFFSKGLKALATRWERCIDRLGEYID